MVSGEGMVKAVEIKVDGLENLRVAMEALAASIEKSSRTLAGMLPTDTYLSSSDDEDDDVDTEPEVERRIRVTE